MLSLTAVAACTSAIGESSPAIPGPDAHGSGAASQGVLAPVLKQGEPLGYAAGWQCPDSSDQCISNNHRRIEAAGQSLQPVCGVDGITDHGKREAVLAAD